MMKNPRYVALEKVGKRGGGLRNTHDQLQALPFAASVFTKKMMQQMLSGEVWENLSAAMQGKAKLKIEYADPIAAAMKKWAAEQGAFFYCHWFHPLTGSSAEKHDSFIDRLDDGHPIEKFSGKYLLQGESDGSSLPSGGLRSTHEARGYTGWDPTSLPFVWKTEDRATLCIPSIFFSWTGEALDNKIPLIRSDKKLNDAALRLLKLTGIPAQQVFSTLGCEQEYFIIDRALHNLRPDLLLAGRTVFGASPSKGQQLQDHYFGAVKDRVLSYMHDFERTALELGIPVKTRHNEVAPAQHEIAPVFEKAVHAVDHNILLMEVMRQTATRHELSCLLHEKPFKGFNGSGKHCNWSLATDTGINLLDPGESPASRFYFLILLVAIVKAVHRHAGLLRAAIGYASNDFRLGGHEAPPPIISVYLGSELEGLLDALEQMKTHHPSLQKFFELGFDTAPQFIKDHTDRNRTSPFAFTGNKFEFRAVGASANPAFPVTVLNVITAESLNEIIDQIEEKLRNQKTHSDEELFELLQPILAKHVQESKAVRFEGNNYCSSWHEEAVKRGLPIFPKAAHAFDLFKKASTEKVFAGVLSGAELASRYEVATELYTQTLNIEANLKLDLFRTHILPAALKQQHLLATAISSCEALTGEKLPEQTALLKKTMKTVEEAIKIANKLEEAVKQASSLSIPKEINLFYSEQVQPAGERLRMHVDDLETLINDEFWTLPKYRELLYLV